MWPLTLFLLIMTGRWSEDKDTESCPSLLTSALLSHINSSPPSRSPHWSPLTSTDRTSNTNVKPDSCMSETEADRDQHDHRAPQADTPRGSVGY